MFCVFSVTSKVAYATNDTLPIPDINISFGEGTEKTPTEYVDNVKLLMVLTVLTVLPSILILTTGFVRIVTVLSFFKNAIGAAQSIPRQVIVGLALFLTFFVMAPTFTRINEEAVKPYINEEITMEVAVEKGIKPMKDFMLKQTRVKDLKLFLEAGNVEDSVVVEKDDEGIESYNYDKVPLYAIVPAFAISELRTAFEIGFLIFIPFLLVDIVTASVLMSMGMFMLPPAMISLPFKLLLFVLVDGWNLLSQSLILGF
ncbi:flagellar type III secretion system pore protein FliP [Clostridium sp.]|uniref:flagellar type III secretion system pore protein FliP n=1 Tax=Clostridium sp. TaxID=1506 RepID=UPI003216390F